MPKGVWKWIVGIALFPSLVGLITFAVAWGSLNTRVSNLELRSGGVPEALGSINAYLEGIKGDISDIKDTMKDDIKELRRRVNELERR